MQEVRNLLHLSSKGSMIKLLTRQAEPFLAFDRDGTLIRLIPYLRDSKEVSLMPGANDLVTKALELGFKTALITNQSVIERGLATNEQVQEVNAEVERRVFEGTGKGFDLIKYCPHLPSSECKCRKPRTGLLESEANKGLIDLRRSFYVGDVETDVLFANNLGMNSILVTQDFNRDSKASHIVSNLVQIIPILKDIM